MGTHPIFESDFDCLTDRLKLKMSSELACTYAALILNDDGIDITADKLTAILKAAKVDVEPFWPGLFAGALKDVDVTSHTLVPVLVLRLLVVPVVLLPVVRPRKPPRRKRKRQNPPRNPTTTWASDSLTKKQSRCLFLFE